MLPGIGRSASGARQIGSVPGTAWDHGELDSVSALEGLISSSLKKKNCREAWRAGGAGQRAQEASRGAGSPRGLDGNSQYPHSGWLNSLPVPGDLTPPSVLPRALHTH